MAILIPKPLLPTRAVIYIMGALIGAVLGFAVIWFVLNQVFGAFATVGHNIITATNSDTATSDLIETFLDNIVEYMAVIGLIVFGIAAWQYSQKKGVIVAE